MTVDDICAGGNEHFQECVFNLHQERFTLVRSVAKVEVLQGGELR